MEATLRASERLPSATESLTALEARRVGHFAVLRKLGEGGMGSVYMAYDDRLGRRAALKLLHEEHDSDHGRLLREAQALARLSHPNVVQIYEVGEYEGRVFVAMEYVEGPTLTQWLGERPREVPELLDVFIQAGRGLAAAHAGGLIHRDFKPSNVIVGVDGRVRVLDFGLARSAEDAQGGAPQAPRPGDHDDALTSPLTRTGALLGTPAYMSPEQHLGLPLDARSDQFNFCAALYEAVFRARPFEGLEFAALQANVVDGRVRPPPPRDEVSPELAAAILRGLAPDPGARWPSLVVLLDALRRTGGQANRLVERRERLRVAAVSGLAGLAAVFIASALWDTPHDNSPRTMAAFNAAFFGFALLLVPFYLRRFPGPYPRLLMKCGLLMLFASVVVRVLVWRAGLPPTAVGVSETVLYAAVYSTVAVTLRAPRVALTVIVLLLPLVLVLEAGLSPQFLLVGWVVVHPLALLSLQHDRPPRPEDGDLGPATTTPRPAGRPRDTIPP